ncbi:MAG TPA: type IX secretion system membrane protein PorP/SprF [Bacteroidales bacterium]|nr:type IX secretion system membrane protein PorP/SprF [Bacteroidales bacterium]
MKKVIAGKALIIIAAVFSSVLATAQQLPIYSQYLYNKFLINPAVAGSDGYTSVNLTAREQWVGYYGAPRTFSFSVQSRMLKKSYILKESRFRKEIFRPSSDGKVGFGGYVFSDKNGLVQKTGFQFSYAYHTWLRNSTQLSFGLALTGYHYKINEQAIDFEDPNEPWMNNNLRRGMFVPDATFGVYILNAKYSFGFSADQLFEASARIANNAYDNFKVDRHYYIFGSWDFVPAYKTIIQPSFLLRTSELIMPQADFGSTYIYDNSFWAGLSYRTSGALIATLGVKHEKMFFGYAFDFTLQQIQRVTYGTHEITLAFKFGDSMRRYRWLDRY